MNPPTGPRFALGRLVATPMVLERVSADDMQAALHRHIRGDWGELPEEDRTENEVSLKSGLRLVSAYRAANGVRFWIITEADRQSTTILLPEEY